MKRWLLFLLVCIGAVRDVLYAQPPAGEVVYDFYLNLRGIPIEREGTLQFRLPEAVFFYSRGPEGIVCKDFMGNVGDHTLRVTTAYAYGDEKWEYKGVPLECYLRDSLGEMVYTRLDSGYMIVRRLILMNEKVWHREPVPQIEWTLHDSMRTIGPYLCQMATAHFRGRDWTAWFTRTIPVPLGPWKLIGLPGLVVEAHDATGEVAFTAKSVRYGREVNVRPAPPPPDSGQQLTFEEARTFEIDTIRRLRRLLNANNHGRNGGGELPEWAINWNVLERYEQE